MENYEKKYKLALNRIKVLIANVESGSKDCISIDDIQEVYPELKESEDEQFRKHILKCCEETIIADDSGLELSMVTTKRLKAWLEKQGEQPKKHDVCDNCDQQGSCVSPCSMKLVEKQGEQNLANSAKTCKDENTILIIPKFRVGDVIRPKGSTAEYTIESISGECYHGKGWGLHISCDNDYELVEQKPAEWNEEDEQTFIESVEALEDFGKFELADWLKEHKNKFLRPQTTWKPSDKQIMALRWVLNHIPYDSHKEEISGLLEQLKKLKEE